MSIVDYLPAIPKSYWKYFEKAITPTNPLTLAPYEEDTTLFQSIENRMGIVKLLTLQSNSPNLKFSLVTDTQTVTTTISTLIDVGFTGYYIPDIPWMSIADSSTHLYVFNLIANIPFSKNVYAYVTNISNSPVKINAMGFLAIIFEPGFYEALAKVMAGKPI